MNNLHIAGSSKCSGGVYDEVHVSGSAKSSGSIECQDLHVSGAFQSEGSVKVQNDVKISGSLKVDGDMNAREIKISGGCKISGKVECEEMKVSGAIRCKGILSKTISVSGGLNAEEDVEGEKIELKGAANIGGLLNGEEITIVTGSKMDVNKIGQIGGSQITIREGYNETNSLLGFIFQKSQSFSGVVVTSSIEGDTLDLNHVRAERVSGRNIILHEDCKIGKVEYTESYTPDAAASVDEVVKLV